MGVLTRRFVVGLGMGREGRAGDRVDLISPLAFLQLIPTFCIDHWNIFKISQFTGLLRTSLVKVGLFPDIETECLVFL